MKMSGFFVICIAITAFLTIIAMSTCGRQASAQYQDIEISITSGTAKGTSVIVVEWPDGIVEKLVYKDKDAAGDDTGYTKWFKERLEAYEKRQ